MDDHVTPELATPVTPEVPVSGFKALRRTMTVCSERHVEVVDLTKQIRDAVRSVDIKEGLVLVNSLHTTCALCINEFQSALMEVLMAMLRLLVADKGGYKHDDPRYSDCERGNASAHLRAALVGRSVAVGINEGEVALGRFQSILLVELDGPRSRDIDVQMLGV